jgi:hypothetical protein
MPCVCGFRLRPGGGAWSSRAWHWRKRGVGWIRGVEFSIEELMPEEIASVLFC